MCAGACATGCTTSSRQPAHTRHRRQHELQQRFIVVRDARIKSFCTPSVGIDSVAASSHKSGVAALIRAATEDLKRRPVRLVSISSIGIGSVHLTFARMTSQQFSQRHIYTVLCSYEALRATLSCSSGSSSPEGVRSHVALHPAGRQQLATACSSGRAPIQPKGIYRLQIQFLKGIGLGPTPR